MNTPRCHRCRSRSVVGYRGEMLCGACFLAQTESPEAPVSMELPRAISLMTELIDLLRTSGRAAEAAKLTAVMADHEIAS